MRLSRRTLAKKPKAKGCCEKEHVTESKKAQSGTWSKKAPCEDAIQVVLGRCFHAAVYAASQDYFADLNFIDVDEFNDIWMLACKELFDS